MHLVFAQVYQDKEPACFAQPDLQLPWAGKPQPLTMSAATHILNARMMCDFPCWSKALEVKVVSFYSADYRTSALEVMHVQYITQTMHGMAVSIVKMPKCRSGMAGGGITLCRLVWHLLHAPKLHGQQP